MRAFIALGSNMGDRAGYIRRAIELLSGTKGVRVVSVSSLHETEPVGYADQGMFMNAAAELDTDLGPVELLDACLRIEDKLGRVRTVRWGPRTIDLDILLYGGLVIETDRLKIPHPLMHEREFVLKPLSEIAPDAVHPVLGRTVSMLYKNLKGSV